MNSRTSILTTLAALALTAASARPLDTAQVTFTHQLGEFGLIDLYVDGIKVQSNVFPGTTSMFAFDAKTGNRQVMVTPANVAPSSKVLFQSMVKVEHAQKYLLSFKIDKKDVKNYTLDLSTNNE